MIFGIILAGGTGTRMGESQKPKQFLTLGNKAILIHTTEKFTINSKFEKIIVLTPKEWINYTKDLIREYIPDNNVVVIESGELRIDTLNNGMEYILNHYPNEDHVIVTHDAVRPFVTHRVIEDNITHAIKYGACDTVIPATDTIVESRDKKLISNISNRNKMYQGQTPQSFKINKLKELYDNLTQEEKESLSDACKIFTLNNEKVSLVKGEVTNIKITYPYDLKVANFILNDAD